MGAPSAAAATETALIPVANPAAAINALRYEFLPDVILFMRLLRYIYFCGQRRIGE